MDFDDPTENSDSSFHIYRGAYNYFRNNNIYSEETFNVYKDRKEHTVIFMSVLHSRVATGELLTIKTKYVVNKDYIPQTAIVQRILGEDSATEEFEFLVKDNELQYKLTNKEGETSEVTLNTSPRFHIAIPSAASSMLFLRSKKFDSTSKNVYQSWSSKNSWEHENDPISENIAVQRISTNTENINVEGQNLQATEYKVYRNVEEETPDSGPPTGLRVYLSKHMTIPYQIKDPSGTKVQVKFLNHLE